MIYNSDYIGDNKETKERTVWYCGDDIVNKFLDTQDLAFLACCNM